MKSKEKRAARKLRIKGWSLRAIAKKVHCSKGSVSKWIQDIQLTEEQIRNLKNNQDRARAKAANHPNSPKRKWERIRNGIIEEASREIPTNFKKDVLKILGAALYWTEGYNAVRNYFMWANSDPKMVKIMMAFLREICQVSENKIKGRVNIHPHLNIKEAESYWSQVAGIPTSNFNKPLLAISKSSLQKKDSLPLGTFNIIICDVILISKIKGWIKGLTNWADSSVGQNG